MALNIVDLPAPLEPTMVAKSPSFNSKLRFVSAAFSLTVPGLKVFEILPEYFSDVVVTSVEDSSLPYNKPARCYIDGDGYFVIEIKASIYMGADDKDIGAYLGFICHEMCHIFLYKLGFVPILERSFDNGELKPFESVEWQAKALCGELMVPYEATKDMSVEEIMKTYHVSKGFAETRLGL